MARKIKITAIRWLDSVGPDGWRDFDQLGKTIEKGMTPILTLGFVVDEGKDYVIVAATVQFLDGSSLSPMCIPKKCIIERKIWGYEDWFGELEKDD